LKKNDEVGMPAAIQNVVDKVAGLRRSTSQKLESLVQANFSRLIANDSWLQEINNRLIYPNPSR